MIAEWVKGSSRFSIFPPIRTATGFFFMEIRRLGEKFLTAFFVEKWNGRRWKRNCIQTDYRLSDKTAIKCNCSRQCLNVRAYFHEYTVRVMQTFEYFREPYCVCNNDIKVIRAIRM